MLPTDSILFETATVRVGAFRCPVGHPRFRDSGPTQGNLVVFPRSSVWIRHDGRSPFLADPRVVTIYNRGQFYTREAHAGDGDRSDWFSLSDEAARALAGDGPRPYRAALVPSGPDLYLRQRRLFERLRQGVMDPLAAEEEVLAIVARVITRAHQPVRREPRRARDAHRDLAERARCLLGENPAAATDVTGIAARLGVSPFHLCRVFRAQTGTTLHAYRLDLRLRVALEALRDGETNLSGLAFTLGFASHSHFTETVRRHFGRTPSALRRELGARRSA